MIIIWDPNLFETPFSFEGEGFRCSIIVKCLDYLRGKCVFIVFYSKQEKVKG